MELLLLVPFITNAVMFAVKWLSGLSMFKNGEAPKPWLRALLVIFTFIGVLATSFYTGQPVEAGQVKELVIAFLETGILSYLAHAAYNSMARS